MAEKGRSWRAAALALAAACALAGACLLGACAAEGGAASGSGTLKVGVRADVVGFGAFNERTGKYYGAEIDIAEELAHRLGYADVEYATVTPDDRKDTLLSGEVDCLIACYSVADSRAENFDFSPTYYEDSIVLAVEDSSLIKGVSDLSGCTFGTVQGANTAPQLFEHLVGSGFSSGEQLFASSDGTAYDYDTWRLRMYPSYQALSDALESGEVDAMACDGTIAKAYLNADRMVLPDFSIEPQRYAVATQKGSALSAQVSEVMQQMIDDGTVALLIDKWD